MYKIELYEKIVEKLKMELSNDYSPGVKKAIESRISYNLSMMQVERSQLNYSA